MKFIPNPLRCAKHALHVPVAHLKSRLNRAAEALSARISTGFQAPEGHDWPRPAPPETTLMTLLQCDTGLRSPALRRLLEPVVAVVGLGVLASLAAVASTGLVSAILACLLAVLILTYVFGLSLQMNLPGAKTP